MTDDKELSRRAKMWNYLWAARIRGTVEPSRSVDQLADADEPELPLELP